MSRTANLKLLAMSVCVLAFFSFLSCKEEATDFRLSDALREDISQTGKPEYLASPFATTGDRLYMVGHQDGSFPELGWHIQGEMGGIWNHPIKLMDGFDVQLKGKGKSVHLDQAARFVNYPMANMHAFALDPLGLEVERWQFVPDATQGILIQLILRNQEKQDLELELTFSGHADLRPTWLGEKTGMMDGFDQGEFKQDDTSAHWQVKDSLNPWWLYFGTAEKAKKSAQVKNAYSGKGKTFDLTYDLLVPGSGELVMNFIIAGSYKNQEEAKEQYQSLLNSASALFMAKKERYAALANRSLLKISDQTLQSNFEWLKYNSDWMVRDVPEVGRGIMAGIPDYPWWFGVDSEYALQGYLAMGQFETALETIDLLNKLSMEHNGNGRIVHEVSTNGYVFNPGNINETPQFATLIWEMYKWTGRKDLLEKYFPTVEKGLDWLMTEKDSDGNLFPEGFGMMEIHGLDSEMIDVASYTQKAFKDAAKMAEALGKTDQAEKYAAMAQELAEKINREFWSEDFQSYADFIGTDAQAKVLIHDAIIRADTLKKPWAVEELKETLQKIQDNPKPGSRPFVVHHNWVVNTPMEVGLADREKAIIGLKTAEKFVNPFGVFVTGIDRDASAGSDEGSFQGSKVFSYTGAVMTLPTGVQAVSEANYGQSDHALAYIERMNRSFNYALPGSMYEVSPDYGMFTQAWNVYGYAVPIVRQFFGVDPMAADQSIKVKPQLPKTWENVSLENLKIGDNQLSLFFKKEDRGRSIRLEQFQKDWSLLLELPKEALGNYELLNGSLVDSTASALIFKADQGKLELSSNLP